MSNHCAAQTRQKLMEAVNALAQEKGLESITVRDICERSGISNGSFYHHFSSKEALIRHAYLETDHWMTPELLKSCDALPPLEGLLAFLEAYLGYVENELGPVIKEYYILLMKDNASAAFCADRPYVREISRRLAICRNAGKISQRYKLGRLALFTVRFVQGCILNWCVEGTDFCLVDGFRKYSGLFLDGICGKAEA